MSSNLLSRFADLLYYGGEFLSLGLIGEGKPTGVMRAFYRAPARLYAWGLGSLVASHVLVLTTIGRKTSLERRTPIGYLHDAGADIYFLTAGWRGQTDWKRNLEAHPRVKVQIGARHFECAARPATEDESRWVFAEYQRRNPFARRLIERDTGIVPDGRDETLQRLAGHFPVVALPAREAG